jgi:hypothetical protein
LRQLETTGNGTTIQSSERRGHRCSGRLQTAASIDYRDQK